MKKGCNSCEDKAQQGKLYIDKESGLLCAEICEKYEKPEGTLVVVPFICVTCGTTTWKTVDTR